MHHRLEPSTYFHTFGPHPAALELGSGDEVTTWTVDTGGRDHAGKQVCRRGNPLTGPFVVPDARRGDALAVQIEEIEVARSFGLSSCIVLPELVPPAQVRDLPELSLIGWQIQDGYARPIDVGLDRLAVKVSPMIGCIGVAPAKEQVLSSTTAGRHGGNMDCRHMAAGTTLILPVFVDGAYLLLGDGHAAQADGELGGSGIEVPLQLRFRIQVIRKLEVGWPRAETGVDILTIGSGRPLGTALQHAVGEMLRWLQTELGLAARDAHMLLSHCAALEIANASGATVICRLAKELLPRRPA